VSWCGTENQVLERQDYFESPSRRRWLAQWKHIVVALKFGPYRATKSRIRARTCGAIETPREAIACVERSDANRAIQSAKNGWRRAGSPGLRTRGVRCNGMGAAALDPSCAGVTTPALSRQHIRPYIPGPSERILAFDLRGTGKDNPTRWSGPVGRGAAPCSHWIACSPARNGRRARQLNSVVRGPHNHPGCHTNIWLLSHIHANLQAWQRSGSSGMRRRTRKTTISTALHLAWRNSRSRTQTV